jgi:hypothetical protein
MATMAQHRFSGEESNTQSRVSERLEWLRGCKVTVRLTYPEIGQLGGEQFKAVYEDTLPLGRAYFFVFSVAGRRRLVSTTSVIEIETDGAVDGGA